MSSATYRALLRTPGAAAFFLTATAGRMGIAMTGLALIWLVHDRTGSYAVAGLVTGCFAVAEALAGPQVARVVDRFGQTRVLPGVLLAHTAAVASLLLLTTGGAPHGLLAAAGALAGGTIPQLGALSAARWSALLRDEREALPTAFALESLANGVCFLAGPPLVALVGVGIDPAYGSALATALAAGGGLAFAAQRRTAPAPAAASERRHAGRSLLRAGFAVQFGVNLGLGLYFGALQVSVTAFAVEHGAAGAAAPLYAASNCAGLLAGWLSGLRRWRGSPEKQLGLVTAGLAVACVPLPAVGTLPGMGIALAVTGLAVPPVLVLSSVLTTAAVEPAALTQAFTWLNSASAAGSAGAAALAGSVVDAHGAQGGFAVAAAATSALAVLASGRSHGARRGT